MFDPGSENGPSSARVCPKGSGPHSAAKHVVCGCSKPSGVPVCPRGRGHILQQNSGFLCVHLGARIKKWSLECSCVSKEVGATFCSKIAAFSLRASIQFSVILGTLKDTSFGWLLGWELEKPTFVTEFSCSENIGRTSRWLRCTKNYTPTADVRSTHLQPQTPQSLNHKPGALNFLSLESETINLKP